MLDPNLLSGVSAAPAVSPINPLGAATSTPSGLVPNAQTVDGIAFPSGYKDAWNAGSFAANTPTVTTGELGKETKAGFNAASDDLQAGQSALAQQQLSRQEQADAYRAAWGEGGTPGTTAGSFGGGTLNGSNSVASGIGSAIGKGIGSLAGPIGSVVGGFLGGEIGRGYNGYGALDGTTTAAEGPGTIGSRDTHGSNEAAADDGGPGASGAAGAADGQDGSEGNGHGGESGNGGW